MLTSIQFDCQALAGTIEIDHVWPRRILPTEFPSAQAPIPQQAPELPLSVCGFPPLLSGEFDGA